MASATAALIRRQRLTAVLEDARLEVGADYACVHTFSTDGERLLCQATTRRLGGGRLTFAIDARESKGCLQARETGQVVLVSDASTDMRTARIAHRRYGLAACLYTPVGSPGAQDAVMVFARRLAHTWSPLQRETAERWGRKVAHEVRVELHEPPSLDELASGLPGWWGIIDDRGSWIDGRWSAKDAPTLAQVLSIPRRGQQIAAAIRDCGEAQQPGQRQMFTITWRARVYQLLLASLESERVSVCLLELGTPGAELFGEQEAGVRAMVSGWNHELNNALQLLAGAVDDPVDLAQAAREAIRCGRALSEHLADFAGHPTPPAPRPPRGSVPAHCRVLIVEDHGALARSLSRVLRQAGYHVETASSVEQALVALDAAVPDVLICDLMLPDGTGADVLNATEGRLGDTRILGMTGYTEADILHAFQRRLIPVLRKPFDTDALLALLEPVA